MIIRDKCPSCFPQAAPLLSVEMAIKDIWLDIVGLKKTLDFLRLQYVKISTKTPVA